MSRNIAMWSGPRNISTAMMYAFGNRSDCLAWDEPFYAYSLLAKGNNHPLREVIIAANETNWDRLVEQCTANIFEPLFYQKHMTHHMPEKFKDDWIHKLHNAFLIRSPEKVLASYAQKWSDVTLNDIGFVQQTALFDRVAQKLGKAPPVIEAEAVAVQPELLLRALCSALEIVFDEAMLTWPMGPKTFDGVWAPHWYNAAWKSTGFTAMGGSSTPLTSPLQKIADEAWPYYLTLKAYAL